MKKIVIYFASRGDLGHSLLAINIARALKDRCGSAVRIYAFQAGIDQKFLHFPAGTEHFNVPHPFYNKWDFHDNEPIPSSQVVKIRQNYILNKIKIIKPHVFVTDFFPFGNKDLQYELFPVIKYLKSRSAKIYSSVMHPYFVRMDIKWLISACDLYDGIFIHAPRDLDIKYFAGCIGKEKFISRREYLSFFNRIDKKTVYTGYVLPEETFNQQYLKERKGDKKTVFISRGGGAFYPKIISASLLSIKYLPEEFTFRIAAGPATSDKEMKVFKECLRKIPENRVVFKKYEKNFSRYLSDCNLFLGTAGYTNSAQLLYLRKKAILIPFRGYSPKIFHAEQLSHARLLKDYAGATILEYSRLNPRNIARLIQGKAKVENKIKKINKSWFNGAKSTAGFLMRS